MSNQVNETGKIAGRRNLLKAFVGGGAVAAALPDGWIRPVVDAVLLPAHAAASACQFYGVTGFVDQAFEDGESATICVEVCGNQATATFQTDSDGTAYVRRTGTFTNGSGTMQVTSFGPGCGGASDRQATLTNITTSSLTFTMQRGQNAGGPLVATLNAMSSCPTFIPINGSCL